MQRAITIPNIPQNENSKSIPPESMRVPPTLPATLPAVADTFCSHAVSFPPLSFRYAAGCGKVL